MNADIKAPEEFLEILDKLIVEENYLPEQVFNIEKISLFWKPGLKDFHLWEGQVSAKFQGL